MIKGAVDDAATALSGIAGSGGGPYNQIIWHKHLASNPNSVELVTTTVAQDVLATQRRRLRKVSRHRARGPA
jgi:nicotinamide mononucleotide (NMN) deamidase PncC